MNNNENYEGCKSLMKTVSYSILYARPSLQQVPVNTCIMYDAKCNDTQLQFPKYHDYTNVYQYFSILVLYRCWMVIVIFTPFKLLKHRELCLFNQIECYSSLKLMDFFSVCLKFFKAPIRFSYQYLLVHVYAIIFTFKFECFLITFKRTLLYKEIKIV